MPLPPKPTLTPSPPFPTRGEDPQDFATKANDFVAWQANDMRPDVQAALDWTESAVAETENIFDDTVLEKTAAQTARSGAEAARDLAEGYRDGAEDARDLAEDYRDGAQTAAAAAQSAAGLPSLVGNAGKVLKVGPGEDNVLWDVGVDEGYQEFTSSGTWNKPSTATWVYSETWGAGASGSAGGGGGGGGGGFNSGLFRASDLTSSITVTIGAGGSAVSVATTTWTPGNDGGDSSFGAHLIALGGKTPTNSTDGGDGGGGELGAKRGADLRSATQGGYSSGGGGAQVSGIAGYTNGGSSVKGGGGGGSTVGLGGTSVDGGDGGNGISGNSASDLTADSGQTPGGGGGAAFNNGAGLAISGAGGNGRVRVWWW